MATSILAKLIELAYDQSQADLPPYEIENRLIDSLLGKSLEFSVDENQIAEISFHGIGRGSERPSTVVSLQVQGVDFEQSTDRLTLDFRYIFYNLFGHDYLFSNVEFLVTSPTVQKLGEDNILIEFVLYGETVYQVNRSLETFAKLIKTHQSELHQTAIRIYEDHSQEYQSGNYEIRLEEPISSNVPAGKPLHYIRESASDEYYIEEYIEYIDDPEDSNRELIDNRNTFASRELE